jgi:ABC-2 type transport system permease protein
MTAYLRLEVVRQFRQRDALGWRLALPAGLYVLFMAVLPSEPGDTSEGLPSDAAALVAFAVLGVVLSGLNATGPRLAQERSTGWLRQLRVTPLPGPAVVVGKVAAALAFALPSIVLVCLAAAVTQDVDLPLGRWLELVALLWVATAPFAALGVLIGLAIADPEAAQSAVGASLIVLWLLGGMVTSPSDLPGALHTIAHLMPTNAAAELGWAAARGDSIAAAASAVVACWTLSAGALGVLAWRRLAGPR